MPTLIPSRPAAACALALALALVCAAPAAAKGVSAKLRVVGAGGRILAEETLATGTTTVPTSPQATCLGGTGTGGSGKAATIQGATALGLLGQASKSDAALRPLLITDHFSFGLGLCGVGSFVAGETGPSWYLKLNHKDPEMSGDAVKLHAGDEVLWAFVSYPYPAELALKAPQRARAGKPFKVRVFAYADDGTRSPAAGVKVSGASGPTGADGRTTVTLARPARLSARLAGDIPSNRAAVCVGGKCPRG